MGAMGAPRASDLNRLFQAWGFEQVPGKVAGDRENAVQVSYQDGGKVKQVRYVVWQRFGQDAIDREDVVTSLLNEMFLESPGVLRPTLDATTTFTPLIQTSEESMEVDVGMLQFMPDPERLLSQFVPGFERLTVAARVSGDVQSAFPDGPPGAAADDTPPMDEEVDEEGDEDGESPEDESGETPEADGDHLAASAGPINVIVAADVDMLWDERWVQEQRFAGLSLGWQKVSDNGDFLTNALENLIGGEELLSIGVRGGYSRPFGRVEEIQRDAEQRYLSQEQELEQRLQEAEQRINELQKEKATDSALILSPEQQAELKRARQDMLDTKRSLRDVQHNLRKDIERLGSRLKLINIALVPLVVGVAALALGTYRIRRRAR